MECTFSKSTAFSLTNFGLCNDFFRACDAIKKVEVTSKPDLIKLKRTTCIGIDSFSRSSCKKIDLFDNYSPISEKKVEKS